MSVTINTWNNWDKDFKPETAEGNVSAFINPATKKIAMVYVEVNSGTAKLAVSIVDESIPNKKFSVSQFLNGIVGEQDMLFTKAGKYRIPIAIADNEEEVHFTLTGDDAEMWVILESEKN